MERPIYLTRQRWNQYNLPPLPKEKPPSPINCAICLETVNTNIKIFHKKKYKNVSQKEKINRLHKGKTAYPLSQKITSLPCKHEFHENCIKKWFRRSPTCPLCRK